MKIVLPVAGRVFVVLISVRVPVTAINRTLPDDNGRLLHDRSAVTLRLDGSRLRDDLLTHRLVMMCVGRRSVDGRRRSHTCRRTPTKHHTQHGKQYSSSLIHGPLLWGNLSPCIIPHHITSSTIPKTPVYGSKMGPSPVLPLSHGAI